MWEKYIPQSQVIFTSSLLMNKIFSEIVKSQCHVLHRKTIKEKSTSSCNEINHQLKLPSCPQILQLHMIQFWCSIICMCKSETILPQESCIYLFKCKSSPSYTGYVHSKGLNRNVLEVVKMHVKFQAPAYLHILFSFSYVVKGSIMSFLWLSLTDCISNHISELPQRLIEFLVQYLERSNFSVTQFIFLLSCPLSVQ